MEKVLTSWEQEMVTEMRIVAKRPLEDILAEMRALREPGDAEISHSRADHLLCSALLQLGADDPRVQELVRAYVQVDKWYA